MSRRSAAASIRVADTTLRFLVVAPPVFNPGYPEGHLVQLRAQCADQPYGLSSLTTFHQRGGNLVRSVFELLAGLFLHKQRHKIAYRTGFEPGMLLPDEDVDDHW
jgi:hypothetical protein